MKLSRRDLSIAVLASTLTGSLMLLAQAAKPGLVGSQIWEFSKLPMSKTPVGETRPVISGPTATLNNLEMHITTLNPGAASHPPHQHPNEELVILTKGNLEGFVHGKWIPMPQGSIMLNASNDFHAVRNASKTESAMYYVVNWTSPMTPKATPAK